MQRFRIDNYFRKVSMHQFKNMAERLTSNLKEIRPGINSIILSTTNRRDYECEGSLTILTRGKLEANNRREESNLSDLSRFSCAHKG